MNQLLDKPPGHLIHDNDLLDKPVQQRNSLTQYVSFVPQRTIYETQNVCNTSDRELALR